MERQTIPSFFRYTSEPIQEYGFNPQENTS